MFNLFFNKNSNSNEIPQPSDPANQILVADNARPDIHLVHVKDLQEVDERLFFHLHANSFGSGSGLEGASHSIALRFLSSYFTDRSLQQKDPLFKKVAEVLECSKDISGIFDKDTYITTVSGKISSIFNNPGEILLLSGGWSGNPSGHAIYYEIVADSHRSASIRFYNLGAGISHHPHAIVGNKDKIIFLEWKGISRLALEDRSLAEVFWEFHHPSQYNEDYDSHDIYLSLKKWLNPKEVVNFISPDYLMSEQRSGVCTIKSLLSFIRSFMLRIDPQKGLEKYKLFKTDIRVQTHCAFIKQFNVDKLPRIRTWRLIEKSFRKINRSTQKLLDKGYASDTYRQEVSLALKDTSDWVNDIYGRLIGNFPENQLSPFESAISNIGYIVEKSGLHSICKEDIDIGVKSSVSNSIVNDFIFKPHSNRTISQHLLMCIPIAKKAWLAADDEPLHTAVLALISSLPLEASFWEKAVPSKDDKKLMITQLGDVSDYFFRSCFTTAEADIVFPERLYALLKIWFLQYQLSGQIDPIWNTVAPHLKMKELLDHSHYMRFFDTKQIDEINNILNLITQDGKPSFPIRLSGMSITLYDFDKKYFLVKIPEIYNSNKDPEFFVQPTFHKESLLYASNTLPEWVKACRDSFHRLDYYETNNIRKLPRLDRLNDFKLNFKVELREGASKTTISFTGNQNSAAAYIGKKFMSTHCLFDVPAKQELINYLTNHFRLLKSPRSESNLAEDEKKLISEYAYQDDLLEMAHLFLEPDLQIEETLEYFIRYPEKLRNIDDQVLFKILMFRPGALNECSHITATKLNDFLNYSFTQYHAQNEIQTCAFLMQMQRYFSHFLTHVPTAKVQENDLFNLDSAMNNLNSLFVLAANDEQRSVIHAEISAHLSGKKLLNNMETAALLKGLTHLYSIPVPQAYKDPEIVKELRKAPYIHSSEIISLLYDSKQGVNHACINELITKSNPNQKPLKWEKKDNGENYIYFVSEDGNLSFDPLKMIFTSKNYGGLASIPEKIVKHPYFINLFPSIKLGEQRAHNIFTFRDDNDIETLVQEKNDRVVIEQKRNDNLWWRYNQSRHIDIDIFGSYSLTQHYHHWRCDDQLIFIPKQNPSSPPAYRIEIQDDELHRSSDDLILGKPSAYLRRFEHPLQIHEWYDHQGSLQEIELPRYGLTFYIDPHSKKFSCPLFEGYVLDVNAAIPALGAYGRLHNIVNYMVLKNDKGDQKVLIAQRPHEAPEHFKEVLSPIFKMELSEKESSLQSYHIYNVKNEGSLIADSREGNLYLIYLLTLVQEYDKAVSYLAKYGKKLYRYLPEEIQQLTNIATIDKITNDIDGNNCFIQAFSSFLIFKNELLYDKISEHTLATLNTNYLRYLNAYHNVTCLRFREHDELLIIKTLLSNNDNPFILNRLEALDPKNALLLNPIFLKSKESTAAISKSDLSNMLGKLRINNQLSREKPNKPLSLTRGHATILEHFFYFFDIAKGKDSQEKKRLQTALYFWNDRMKDENQALSILMDTIIKNPASFKNYLPLDHKDNSLHEWLNKLINTVVELYIPESIAEIDKNINNLPPIHFQWQNPYKMMPPVALALDFQTQIMTFKELLKDNFIPVEMRWEALDKDVVDSQMLSWAGMNQSEKQEASRISKDFDTYKIQQNVATYRLDKKGIEKLKDFIKKNSAPIELNINDQKQKILLLANATFDTVSQSKELTILRNGGLRKELSLDELILCFATKNASELQKQNPYLSEENIQKLFNLIGEHLLLATHLQQIKRSENMLKSLEALPRENEDAIDLLELLSQEVSTSRNYIASEHPAYLAFEYYNNILMRTAQVEKLKLFLSSGNLNPVMEMIMGSGKSKVLLPLLSLLRADDKTLSLLVVPQSLFESVASDTQQAVLNAFGKEIHSFYFERSTDFSEEYIQAILDDLKSIKDNKEAIIMASKSIQCLLLKYFELWDYHIKNKSMDGKQSHQLVLMNRLIDTIQRFSHPNLDEADTILNVLHEVCFSTGTSRAPNFLDMRLISELYCLRYENKEINKIAYAECDPQAVRDPKACALTDQVYQTKVKKPLAEAFIERLQNIRIGRESDDIELQKFYNNILLNPEQKNLALAYLCRDEDKLDDAQTFFSKQSDVVKDTLALISKQLNEFLCHTLTHTCDENYGVADMSQGEIAIPFRAVNTPNIGSQFANPYVTMNYTFQTYIKKHIPKDLIIKEMTRLQHMALHEQKGKMGISTIEKTEGWKLYKKLIGNINPPIPLFNFTDDEMDRLTKYVNTSHVNICDFVIRFVLPKLQLFEEKMACNPHNLVSLFSRISGFTGTLWNGMSMHKNLQAHPENGIEAKTITLLYHKTKNHEMICANEGSTKSMLQQININYDMIIDIGGYFKDASTTDIAAEIARHLNKPVAYYNSSGELVCKENQREIPLSQSKLSENQRVTFLDQVHTTGSDVKQHRQAVAVVTIGRNTLLRDLLQGVWRLRGIELSQTPIFWVCPSVADLIRQTLNKPHDEPITFKDILCFTISNQAHQQGKHNFKALVQEMWNIPQQMLVNILSDSQISYANKQKAFNVLRSCWIKPSQFNPKDLFGNLEIKMPSSKVVDIERESCMRFIEMTFAKLDFLADVKIGPNSKTNYTLAFCQNEVSSICQRLKDFLPETLLKTNHDQDQCVEIEQEVKMELQIQQVNHIPNVRLDKLASDGIKTYATLNREVFKHDKTCPIFPLNSYFQQTPSFADLRDSFDDVFISLNVFQWQNKPQSVSGLTLFGAQHTPLHFAIVPPGADNIALLSQQEAAYFFQKGKKSCGSTDSNNTSRYLYNLITGYCFTNGKPSPKQELAIVKAKFLGGEIFLYSEAEMKLLQQWILESGTIGLRKLFEKSIIGSSAKKIAKYQGSELQKILNIQSVDIPHKNEKKPSKHVNFENFEEDLLHTSSVARFFVKLDQIADYVPILSTIATVINLFQKFIVSIVSCFTTINNSYYRYIAKKSYGRCLLVALPVIGNIAVAIYDYKNYRRL